MILFNKEAKSKIKKQNMKSKRRSKRGKSVISMKKKRLSKKGSLSLKKLKTKSTISAKKESKSLIGLKKLEKMKSTVSLRKHRKSFNKSLKKRTSSKSLKRRSKKSLRGKKMRRRSKRKFVKGQRSKLSIDSSTSSSTAGKELSKTLIEPIKTIQSVKSLDVTKVDILIKDGSKEIVKEFEIKQNGEIKIEIGKEIDMKQNNIENERLTKQLLKLLSKSSPPEKFPSGGISLTKSPPLPKGLSMGKSPSPLLKGLSIGKSPPSVKQKSGKPKGSPLPPPPLPGISKKSIEKLRKEISKETIEEISKESFGGISKDSIEISKESVDGISKESVGGISKESVGEISKDTMKLSKETLGKSEDLLKGKSAIKQKLSRKRSKSKRSRRSKHKAKKLAGVIPITSSEGDMGKMKLKKEKSRRFSQKRSLRRKSKLRRVSEIRKIKLDGKLKKTGTPPGTKTPQLSREKSKSTRPDSRAAILAGSAATVAAASTATVLAAESLGKQYKSRTKGKSMTRQGSKRRKLKRRRSKLGVRKGISAMSDISRGRSPIKVERSQLLSTETVNNLKGDPTKVSSALRLDSEGKILRPDKTGSTEKSTSKKASKFFLLEKKEIQLT